MVRRDIHLLLVHLILRQAKYVCGLGLTTITAVSAEENVLQRAIIIMASVSSNTAENRQQLHYIMYKMYTTHIHSSRRVYFSAVWLTV